ncbi:hypothetical protein R70241_04279 [Paraburkholderia saeva]|nr:hypothetical protein R70241_04279 [Paraburkholderia saeva]
MSEFHIDHILPETLADDPAALADVVSKLNLGDDFSLFGYENLVPVAPGPNLQKGKVVFDPEFCRYYLAIAAAKKAKVEGELAKIDRRNTRGKVILLLQEALESGKLRGEEVAEILEQHNEKPEEIFQLLEAIGFESGHVETIAKSDIESLRDRPVIASGKSLILDHATLEHVYVQTCREYEEAIKQGYYANNTYAIKTAAIFEHRCGLLNALQRAVPATKSFIDSPRVGVVDVHLLPFRLFPQLSPDASEEELAGTYQDKLNNGSLVIQAVRQNLLRVAEPEGTGHQLIEVARADFNGNGIEDILVFEYMWATHGTFGAGGIRIFTRTSADGPFEEVLQV